MQAPKDVKELEAILGLMNFFGRMLPDFASRIKPLNALRKKDAKFNWEERHQCTLKDLIEDLTKPPVLKRYSINREATLTTDASEGQIGACLTQEGFPIMFISRTLSSAERNYSNIEKEALAIFWAVTRLRRLLLGRRFTLITDHKPLECLFGPKQPLPKVASARVTRWAIELSRTWRTIEWPCP